MSTYTSASTWDGIDYLLLLVGFGLFFFLLLAGFGVVIWLMDRDGR